MISGPKNSKPQLNNKVVCLRTVVNDLPKTDVKQFINHL